MYPELRSSIEDVISKLMDEQERTALERTIEMLEQVEDIYVCTPGFDDMVTQLEALALAPNDDLKTLLHRIRGIPLEDLEDLMKVKDAQEGKIQVNLYVYFKLACERLGDQIPLMMRQHFLHKMSEQVPQRLQ